MNLKIITPPVIEPVTLAEAKSQCRVDIAEDDAFLTALIGRAREYVERLDWRAFLTQTIELWLDAWPGMRYLTLPRPPLQSVTKIEYYGSDDTKYTLSPLAYYVSQATQPGKVQLRVDQAWPGVALREMDAICVTYVAGWTAAASVPKTIQQACLLLIGHWYENREGSTVGAVNREIEMGVQALINLDRAARF